MKRALLAGLSIATTFALAVPGFAEEAPPAAPPQATPAPQPTPPPPAAPKPGIKLEMHGFVSGSVYMQDAATGPGMGGQAWYLAGKGSNPDHDKNILGADVRQTRLRWVLTGPEGVFLGATPSALAEIDFFGGYSPGSYGDVSLMPRMRIAYAELKWANTALRFGQDHELILGVAPATVGHQAFPVTDTAGMLGWREPGIGAFHTIPIADKTNVELAAQVIRSEWRSPLVLTAPVGGTTQLVPDWGGNGVSAGEFSARPGVELRARLTLPFLMVFAAGHWNRVHPAGYGVADPTWGTNRDFDVAVGVAGLKLTLAGFTVQGSGYTGKNLAPLLGEVLQFPAVSASATGSTATGTTAQVAYLHDVRENGGWLQLGYDITPELSLWALAGTAQLDSTAVRNSAGMSRLLNSVFSAMARYQVGGFAIALEYTRWMTKTTITTDTVTPSGNYKGNQYMLTGAYTF